MGLENMVMLAESLRDFEPQTVRFEQSQPVQASRNPGGTWDVPLEVNGTSGSWIFDTGANISVIAESEAARMGLAIRETKASVTGSTGRRNGMKLALANRVRLGPAQLQNVVLIVLPDEALRFPQVNFQIKGFLGLPVIRALECVGISAQGTLRMGRDACLTADSPNLFFEDLALIAEAPVREYRLQMLLDSGANATDLYPSSRPGLGGARFAKRSEQVGGTGKTVNHKIQSVAALTMDLGGKPVRLQDITLARKQPASRCRDGLIGMDALGGGFRLDFKTMQLRLD